MRHNVLVPIVTVFVFVMRDSFKSPMSREKKRQKQKKKKRKEKREKRNLHTTDRTTVDEY